MLKASFRPDASQRAFLAEQNSAIAAVFPPKQYRDDLGLLW
jgi:hypothetical protein